MSQTEEGLGGKLGEYLAAHEQLSQEKLVDALKTQEKYRQHSIPTRIGEVLVDSGACTVGAVAKALHLQRDQQVRETELAIQLFQCGVEHLIVYQPAVLVEPETAILCRFQVSRIALHDFAGPQALRQRVHILPAGTSGDMRAV